MGHKFKAGDKVKIIGYGEDIFTLIDPLPSPNLGFWIARNENVMLDTPILSEKQMRIVEEEKKSKFKVGDKVISNQGTLSYERLFTLTMFLGKGFSLDNSLMWEAVDERGNEWRLFDHRLTLAEEEIKSKFKAGDKVTVTDSAIETANNDYGNLFKVGDVFTLDYRANQCELCTDPRWLCFNHNGLTAIFHESGMYLADDDFDESEDKKDETAFRQNVIAQLDRIETRLDAVLKKAFISELQEKSRSLFAKEIIALLKSEKEPLAKGIGKLPKRPNIKELMNNIKLNGLSKMILDYCFITKWDTDGGKIYLQLWKDVGMEQNETARSRYTSRIQEAFREYYKNPEIEVYIDFFPKDPKHISEVISKYIFLECAGVPGGMFETKFYGLCPFHKEKTPSFTVDDSSETFHCFGCGAEGDVDDFIRKIESTIKKDEK